jgi:cytochrome P460
MSINFQRSGIAVVVVSLLCALVIFIGHFKNGTITSAQPINFSATRQVKEIDGYRNWTKVNSIPQLMPARVAAACADALARNNGNNPHRNKYFTVYVNAVGGNAMLNQVHPDFPEGSIIVKEKLSAKDSQTPELLTVMIKQRKGFNPESGDWEYMVLDGTGTKLKERGSMQHCQNCHIANQDTDYIFRTYLPEEGQSNLK